MAAKEKQVRTRADSMAELVQGINKTVGRGLVLPASSKIFRPPLIPTGILAYDLSLGGGFPMGAVQGFVGEYSSSKSTMLYIHYAAIQRTCRNCLKPMMRWHPAFAMGTPIECCKNPEPMRASHCDNESAFRPDLAQAYGVDLDELLVAPVSSAEELVDLVNTLLSSGQMDYIGIDSLAAATPEIEMTSSASDAHVGTQARLLNRAFRTWISELNRFPESRLYRPGIGYVNQIRMKVGTAANYGDPRTQPGGKGQEFSASIITEMKREAYLTAPGHDDEILGQQVSATHRKSRQTAPRKSAMFSLALEDIPDMGITRGGTDIAHQVIDLGSRFELIKKSGSYYYYENELLGQGKNKAAIEIVAQEGLLDALIDKITRLALPRSFQP